MNSDTLFRHLSPDSIIDMISKAKQYICYAAPGIHIEPARKIVEAIDRLGIEMITVCLDGSESVLRMGYGDLDAIKTLVDAKFRLITRLVFVMR